MHLIIGCGEAERLYRERGIPSSSTVPHNQIQHQIPPSLADHIPHRHRRQTHFDQFPPPTDFVESTMDISVPYC